MSTVDAGKLLDRQLILAAIHQQHEKAMEVWRGEENHNSPLTYMAALTWLQDEIAKGTFDSPVANEGGLMPCPFCGIDPIPDATQDGLCEHPENRACPLSYGLFKPEEWNTRASHSGGWIPVSEKLPLDGHDIRYRLFNGHVLNGQFENNVCLFFSTCGSRHRYDEVRDWQPLPPTQGEKG